MSGGIEQRQPAQSGEDDIDGVAAGVDQKIHVLSAVMHRVKSPKEDAFMAPSMTPVKANFAHDHGCCHARPQRQPGRRSGNGRWQSRVNDPGDQERGWREKERGEEAVKEIPAEIDPPALREQADRANGEDMFGLGRSSANYSVWAGRFAGNKRRALSDGAH